MPKFRKKPIVVEAEQWFGLGGAKGLCFCDFDGSKHFGMPHVHTIHNDQVIEVEVDDWILPEPDGIHYYPVKPDIFAETYEPVDERESILKYDLANQAISALLEPMGTGVVLDYIEPNLRKRFLKAVGLTNG